MQLLLAVLVLLTGSLVVSTQASAATYPDGTLIKSTSGAEVDRMENGVRRWIPDPATFTCMGLDWNAIQTVPDSDFNALPAGTPYPSRKDNTLLQGSDARVYVVTGCMRHWIPDPATFKANGWQWNQVQHIADADLNAIPQGPQWVTPLSAPVLGSTAIRHVVIHNLYMDNNWDANNPTLSRATLDDFTNKLVLSGYFSKAAQYGVADAAFTGSDQATAACPAPGPTFDYFALSSWVLCEKHHLPAYSANGTGVNLWQVYVPVQTSMHMSIRWPWGHTWQIVQNCQTLGGSPWGGFHAQTLPSIVPPDVPQTFGAVFPGCVGGSLLNVTEVASHELIEAATDPGGFAWGTGALTGNTEAGDLCENGTPSSGFIDGGTYQIAAYQSNADGGCVVPGAGLPSARLFSTTFSVDASGSPHDIDEWHTFNPPAGCAIDTNSVHVTPIVHRGNAKVLEVQNSKDAVRVHVWAQMADTSLIGGHHSGAMDVTVSYTYYGAC